MAILTDLSVDTFKKGRKGCHMPYFQNLIKIAEVLEVSPAELVFDDLDTPDIICSIEHKLRFLTRAELEKFDAMLSVAFKRQVSSFSNKTTSEPNEE